MSTADDEKIPRHRKPGRAHKRGRAVPGRRVRGGAAEPIPPPGSYPVEDLAGMSSSAASLLLHRAMAEAEAGVAAHEHVLVLTEVETGVSTTSQPYPNGLDALTAALDYLEHRRTSGSAPEVTLTVVPQPEEQQED